MKVIQGSFIVVDFKSVITTEQLDHYFSNINVITMF